MPLRSPGPKGRAALSARRAVSLKWSGGALSRERRLGLVGGGHRQAEGRLSLAEEGDLSRERDGALTQERLIAEAEEYVSLVRRRGLSVESEGSLYMET
jgi:hypothetical protein